MLQQLKALFMGADDSTNATPDHRQLSIAATALMVQLARVDQNQDQRELEAILERARRSRGLSEAEAKDILEEAQSQADDATSLYEFTGVLNQQLSQDEKAKILESIWHVALADGVVDKYEEHLIRRIADLLHLNHREFMQCRFDAEAAMKS